MAAEINKICELPSTNHQESKLRLNINQTKLLNSFGIAHISNHTNNN